MLAQKEVTDMLSPPKSASPTLEKSGKKPESACGGLRKDSLPENTGAELLRNDGSWRPRILGFVCRAVSEAT